MTALERIDPLLIALVTRDDRRWILVGASAALLAAGVMVCFISVVVGLPLGLIGAAGGAAYVLGLLAVRRQRAHRLQQDIMSHLRQTGLRRFDVGDVNGFGHAPEDIQRRAASDVYALYCGAAFKDGEVTDQERNQLDHLAKGLKLADDVKAIVEKRQAGAAYSRLVNAVLADGQVTSDEASLLTEARRHLAISDDEAAKLNRKQLEDAYRALFRRFAEDGVLTDDELEELERFRDATGLSAQEAAKISRNDAASLFARAVAMTCQNDVIPKSQRGKLQRLGQILLLPPNAVNDGLKQFDRAFSLLEIRRGNLPTVRTRLLLRSSEVCHYEERCVYERTTPTRVVEVHGAVTVTDRRLIFTGERSFEVSTKRIVDMQEYTNAVDLTVTSGRGQGRYYVDDGSMMAAVLGAIVRSYNREQFETLDSSRSRHIPDSVKVEVWRRDGGRCVRCGANDYLEFDHIIPFSRGGANTARNLQLLCRRCNQAKGSEIA